MSFDHAIKTHYHHGSLLHTIEAALLTIGKNPSTVTVNDLAGIDEFHIGGRHATEQLIQQLSIKATSHLLDIGCGLGGAARHISSKYGCHVTGIDLTPEYVETGNTLSSWLNLEDKVHLHCGSALTSPFANHSFNGAYMLHVGMNINDKAALFDEIYRVLSPNTCLAIYDVMRAQSGELLYPVPWASDDATSYLASVNEYKKALTSAGFTIVKENNRRDFALAFFEQVRQTNKKASSPPALSLHTLMGQSAPDKLANMVKNVSNGLIAPIEVIAKKT